MNILITGGNGYIASSIRNTLDSKYNITSLTRQELDITDTCMVREWFEDKHFDVVIHTAISGGSRLKIDSYSAMDSNLKMYYNLLDNSEHFDRFISIGSGAELYQLHTPYGLSKEVIRRSMLEKDGFYNLRVFAVFDENELETRFIKANINRYINKLPMVIYQDKKMDFFYMKDFVKVIQYYLTIQNPIKEFNCTYSTTNYLSQIATKINSLSNYNVDIIVENTTPTTDYVGNETPIGITYDGLEVGINHVYNQLICKI